MGKPNSAQSVREETVQKAANRITKERLPILRIHLTSLFLATIGFAIPTVIAPILAIWHDWRWLPTMLVFLVFTAITARFYTLAIDIYHAAETRLNVNPETATTRTVDILRTPESPREATQEDNSSTSK